MRAVLQTAGVRVGFTGLKQHAVGCPPFMDDLPHLWKTFEAAGACVIAVCLFIVILLRNNTGYETALLEDRCDTPLHFRRQPSHWYVNYQWFCSNVGDMCCQVDEKGLVCD